MLLVYGMGLFCTAMLTLCLLEVQTDDSENYSLVVLTSLASGIFWPLTIIPVLLYYAYVLLTER